MSERDLIEGLNDSLAPEDLMMVDEDRGIAEQNARLARLRGEPGAQERSIRAPNAGKGSWYSQLPEHGWVDRQDRPGSNALGVRDENQGIALPSRATLGQWFDVTFPDGSTHRLQQTDVGPAKWTGKGIDISAAAAHQAGYTPKNFPTGAGFTWKPAEGEPSYDTEDRTAVGLGGSRAYEATTVPDTGQRQMADQPRGIMDFLTGGQQQQQPGGLLGMLGDPETMAYLAMIAKGASPYSALDPNSMLSNAQTLAMRRQLEMQRQRENAIDNARADRALGLREQEYGLQREDRQARDAAAFEERQQRRDLTAKQKEIDDEVRRNLGGGSREEGTATAVPEGTRSAEVQIAQLNRELAKNPSPHIARSIEREIERLQRQETDKAIPAELAGRLGMADVYLKKAPDIAKAIDAGDLTGVIDQPLARFGGALGGKSAEKYRDMQSGVDALTRMMTGAGMPASEAEAYANRYLPALTDDATSLRSKHDRLVQELQTIKATVEKGRIRSPGASKTETEAPKGALPGGWTVREK